VPCPAKNIPWHLLHQRQPSDAWLALLVLLDRAAATMAAVGPFATVSEAESWQPQPLPDHHVDWLVVALTHT
jgi:hypothetical protein